MDPMPAAGTFQADAEGDVGRQDQLVPGVDAIHIGGGVGLGIAQLLGLLQRLAVVKTQPGHGVENIVAGAVHDAADEIDFLHPADPLQLRKPADAAAHCSGAAQAHALLLCQRQQFIIKGSHQSLVGGDHVLARLDAGADKLIGRMQSAHGFHHGINGFILQDGLKIPGHFRIGQGHVFQTYHPHHLHILPACGDLIYTPANHAEAQQSDSHPEILPFICHAGRKQTYLRQKHLLFYRKQYII